MRAPSDCRVVGQMVGAHLDAVVADDVAAITICITRQFLRRPARRRDPRRHTPQECAFESAVAVHAAAPEPCDFPSGIQPRHRLTVGSEHAAVEVSLQSAQCLARENVETDRDQGAGVRVEYLCGLAVRINLSPKYARAPRITVICISLEKELSS